MTKGRRLRLDRRKAGLSQVELADQLGHSLEEISAMENDRLELSTAAVAFCANVPARVPTGKPKAAPPAAGPETAPEPPEPGSEEGKGEPGPRTAVAGGKDKPPRAEKPKPQVLAPRGEIAELEDALLKMFAGERLIVPKQTPDGVVQVEAVIPGIAQVVGMWDEFDGRIIETYGPGMAKAWAELARVNPRVRSVLIGLTYGGAYRGVLAATLPCCVAIAAHHGAFQRPQQPPPVAAAPEGDPTQPPQPGQEGWNGGVPPGTEHLFEGDIG
jgi:transcriptional regulator with XRE-family HTH domain